MYDGNLLQVFYNLQILELKGISKNLDPYCFGCVLHLLLSSIWENAVLLILQHDSVMSKSRIIAIS